MMSLLLNTKKYKQDPDSKHTIYEVAVEGNVQFTGEFSIGPYQFMIAEFDIKNPGEPRELCLRLKNYYEKGKNDTEMPIGDIDSDFVACASLFLRTRFKILGLSRMDDRPMKLSLTKRFVHEALIQDKRKLGDLSEWFSHLFALDESDYNRFLISVRMYQFALEILEQDVNLAYLFLIFSIETLSGDYETTITFDELEDYKEIETLLKKAIEDVKIVEKIKDEIAKRQPKIKKKFIGFIEEYLPDSFWENSHVKYAFAKVKREELKNYLDLIYEYRSLMVHNGIALFDYQTLTLGKSLDIGPGWPCVFGKMVDFIRKKLIENEKEFAGVKSITLKRIPSIIWFERLVNNVLKNYLEILTTSKT